MPIKRCTEKNQPGFKWGDEGKCYVYNPADKVSQKMAREKALNQGRAIEAQRTNEIDDSEKI